MERNVYTWHIALEEGLNPSDYTYDPELIPIGEFEPTSLSHDAKLLQIKN